MNTNRLKEILTAIAAIAIYFLVQAYQTLPLDLLNINVETLPMYVKIIYSLFCEIIILVSIILLFRKTLKENWKDLKEHHQEYFKTYLKYWFLALGIMMISSLIIQIIEPGSVANNEESIRNTLGQAPVYTYISAVFFAPFIEEMLFRQGFRNIFTNKFVFIFISGFIFGGLHVFPSATNLVDYLYLIPYCTPGFIFAYVLTKTNNIFTTIGLHFLHNGILMSIQIFLLLFG